MTMTAPAPATETAAAIEPYVPDLWLPAAWIVDVDGTVALRAEERGPFDWDKAHLDRPNAPVVEVVRALSAHNRIVFVTGRFEAQRAMTLEWLDRHVTRSTRAPMLLTRADGDLRRDDIVKAELFNEHIRAHFHVKGVLDDRDRVVDMWRAMGLTCLQVADGDF